MHAMNLTVMLNFAEKHNTTSENVNAIYATVYLL